MVTSPSRGELDVGDVAPHSSVDQVRVPCAAAPTPRRPSHRSLDTNARATAWAPAGHLVARGTNTRRRPPRRPTPQSAKRRDVSAGGHGSARFRQESAMRLIVAPVRAVDLPGADRQRRLQAACRDLGEAFDREAEGARRVGSAAGVDRRPADELVDHDHHVEVLDDGSMVHHHEVDVPDDLVDLARIGVTFELGPASIGCVGSVEVRSRTTPTATVVPCSAPGKPTIDEPPYLVPQEFGLRTDCRWFEFLDPGHGTGRSTRGARARRAARVGHAVHGRRAVRTPRTRPTSGRAERWSCTPTSPTGGSARRVADRTCSTAIASRRARTASRTAWR